ncbi:hypothetical protein ACFLQI_01810 [Candidatus Undinarchaeota archaeon]
MTKITIKCDCGEKIEGEMENGQQINLKCTNLDKHDGYNQIWQILQYGAQPIPQ